MKNGPASPVPAAVTPKTFPATADLSRLKEPDVISICVPTPLSKTKDPDVSYVLAATNSVKQTLRRGPPLGVGSTPHPGATRGVMLPALQSTGGQKGGRESTPLKS